MQNLFTLLLSLFIVFFSSESTAFKGTYQTPKAFISKTLGEKVEAKMLWLTKEDKAVVADILNHKFQRMRIRYWQFENHTAWVLDEIGKEKPITIGVHISNEQGTYQIKTLKVLTFRESRGDEVRHDFYAKQFINASIDDDNNLTQNIDGITGATMSVRATTKIARLALWLNRKTLSEK